MGARSGNTPELTASSAQTGKPCSGSDSWTARRSASATVVVAVVGRRGRDRPRPHVRCRRWSGGRGSSPRGGGRNWCSSVVRPVVATGGVLVLTLLYHLLGYPGLAPAVRAVRHPLRPRRHRSRACAQPARCRCGDPRGEPHPAAGPRLPTGLGWFGPGAPPPRLRSPGPSALGEAGFARNRVATEARMQARTVDRPGSRPRERLLEERVELAREGARRARAHGHRDRRGRPRQAEEAFEPPNPRRRARRLSRRMRVNRRARHSPNCARR